MNSYLVRRLLPFYVFAIISEFIFKIGLSFYYFEEIDFSVLSIIKTIGILSLTTSVAFIFMMIPYVIYLLFLPQKKAGSRTDKITSSVLFGLFVFLTYFEIISSTVFWNEFQSAFNFIAVDYLVYTHEVLENIIQSYPIWIIVGTTVILSIITVLSVHTYIIPHVPAPKFLLRLFHASIYFGICLLAFRNIDIEDLEITHNRYNNELSKQGTYSLFSAFCKNEIDYSDFYLMENPKDNLALLHKIFQDNNVTFLNPHKNIARQVSSFKPEKRANVIIVLMESMSSKFLKENRPYDWQTDITPNLNKLSKESLFFSNTYATGTRSVRGIEALNLSVPPLPGMSIVRRKNNEHLPSLGMTFKEKGYDNKWIYGGYGYFDNMNYFMENNGFEIIDRAKWSPKEVTFTNAWGTCDEDLYNKILIEADKSYAKEKPFLIFSLSISNHRPYTYPEGKIDLPSKISGREGGVKYADYALGEFLKQVQKKPWFDNTIFIFTADHGAGAARNDEIDIENHHIPLFIYAPKFVTPHRIETPISQIDIVPTLLGLLDLNYESYFFGQDALSPQYTSRVFISNYQKIGYIKDNITVILKPIKQYSIIPENTPQNIYTPLLKEAIAFYQTADNWDNLKTNETNY